MYAFVVVALLLIAVVVVPPLRQRATRLLPHTWQISVSALRHHVTVDHSLRIKMRDGVELAASLYRPAGSDERLPTVLVRLPYGRNAYGEGYNSGLNFARAGFAVVVEDLRGTGDSGGELMPWRDAEQDGVATLDWIVAQPWSNGKVGTFGCSALGETQYVLSKARHPAHAAMIASGAGGAIGKAQGRYSYFGVFEGGIFQLASGFGWFVGDGPKDPHAPEAEPFDVAALLKQLPVSSLAMKARPVPSGYTEYVSTPLGDPRWEEWGYLTDDDVPRTPTLVINTWGDQTAADTLAFAEHARVTQPSVPQKVVIAPGRHCNHEESGDRDMFAELPTTHAERPYREWYVRWFDYWLRGKGDPLKELPAYTYFMLAENRWYEADSWPPANSRPQRWYLGSAGRANSRSGNGTLGAMPSDLAREDSFRYDPMNPVPSRGGPICCTGNPSDIAGPVDQSDVEVRDDVLVYTSAPLDQPLRIAGPLKLTVAVSSSAPDTDLVGRLVDVAPDGKALNIQEGALRLRYREGIESPRLMQPGERYTAVVDMRSIAWRVEKGHRLRLDVTSSSFPRLERNLNTGGVNAEATEPRVAVNTLHYDAGSSFVELPVLED